MKADPSEVLCHHFWLLDGAATRAAEQEHILDVGVGFVAVYGMR
jgi:hypothetical protein